MPGRPALTFTEPEGLVEHERDPATVHVARWSLMGGTEHAARVQASVMELVLEGRGNGVELPEHWTAREVVALPLLTNVADRAGRRLAVPAN